MNSGQFKKGQRTSVKTEFKKGQTPWNKELKGIHLSPDSEFKKGMKPWNVGIIKKSFSGKTINAIHSWVERNFGKPAKCDKCKSDKAKHFEWSNISGQYMAIKSDWQRLCKKCHNRYDFEMFGSRKAFYS